MKKILKTLAFVLVGVLALTAFVACEKKHEHNYKYESDNTKHRQVCEECDDKTEWEAHVWGDWTVTKEATEDAKGSRKHSCTVCSKEVSEAIPEKAPATGVAKELTAVYAQVPADWETVNVYYWNNLTGEENTLGDEYKVVWPGVEMTLVDEATHLYGFKVPAGVNMVIFNNGDAQTVDIPFALAKNLYVLDTEAADQKKIEISYRSYSPKDTDPALGEPVATKIEKMTIYAQLPASWETPKIHYWGVQETKWPGVDLTVVDAEKHLYKYENIVTSSGIIFNNGKDGDECVQTANLSIAEGVDTFVVAEDGKVSFGKYNDGVITPVDLGLPELWLVGSLTNWGFADEKYKLATDELAKKATITAKLTADVEFKVCDSSWGNEVSFSLEGVTDFAAVENSSNIKVVITGVYIITVDFSGDAPTMTISPLTLYCVGGHNGWGDGFVDANKLVLDGETASITVTLTAGTEFKVCDSSWGHEAALNAVDGFSGGNGSNIKCEVAGTYVITVSDLAGTPTITITTPAA